MKEIKFGFDSYVRDGDTIWFTFPEIPAIGKFDCKEKTGTLEKMIPVTKGFADLYSFAALYEGRIIFLPFLDDKVSIYDTDTEILRTIPLPFVPQEKRICYWILYRDYAVVFSNMGEDNVLLFDFNSMCFQPLKKMTREFSNIFEGESTRDFVARSGGNSIVVLDKKGKKLVFLSEYADVVKNVTLESLPFMPLDVFWIDNSVWLNTFDSTSIFQLILDEKEKLIEYPSDSQEFIMDDMHYYPYSFIAGWNDHIIAVNSSKKHPSIVTKNRLVDLPTSDEYDCGLRGFGFGGMYSYVMPYEEKLFVLNYKSNRMLLLDCSMKIIEEIPADIEIEDEIWETIRSEVFHTRLILHETSYMSLKDLLRQENDSQEESV